MGLAIPQRRVRRPTFRYWEYRPRFPLHSLQYRFEQTKQTINNNPHINPYPKIDIPYEETGSHIPSPRNGHPITSFIRFILHLDHPSRWKRDLSSYSIRDGSSFSSHCATTSSLRHVNLHACTSVSYRSTGGTSQETYIVAFDSFELYTCFVSFPSLSYQS